MLFSRRLHTILQRLPASCHVCARWPAQPICQPCINRYGASQSRCTTCARPLQGAQLQCGACLTNKHPLALQACLAAVDYAYPWDNLIAHFKFRGKPALAQPMSSLMLQKHPALGALLLDCNWVVPIPVSPARLAERGYNQAWELAKALLGQAAPVRASGLPMALVRLGQAPDQHNLPAELREKNLKGAFAAHPDHVDRLRGTHVLLVDDVSTTGATLRAAATALRLAGVSQVSAEVFARTAPD